MIHFVTYQDYLRHPVYRAIRRVEWDRASGRCRRCNEPATEVHHNRYPKPWGTFDVPGNLEALCHACHCKEERKPS